MERGEWQATIDLLAEHEAKVDLDSRLCWARGWAHYKLDEFPAAIRSLRKACELAPVEPTALWALGVALRAAGFSDDAEAVLLRAIALRYSSMPRTTLSVLYTDVGRHAEAEQIQREGLRLRPVIASGWRRSPMCSTMSENTKKRLRSVNKPKDFQHPKSGGPSSGKASASSGW